jgi:hypothetical protein
LMMGPPTEPPNCCCWWTVGVSRKGLPPTWRPWNFDSGSRALSVG